MQRCRAPLHTRVQTTRALVPGRGSRIQKRLRAPHKPPQEPVPHVTAQPNPSNLLEWFFVLEGAAGTDYQGGIYMG